jgi:hypothetical protein
VVPLQHGSFERPGPPRDTSNVDLASKLQLKPGQSVECVLAPESVASTLAHVTGDADSDEQMALLVFAAERTALEKQRARIVEAAGRDRLTWVCYPKAGQLGTDLNRDSLAALLAQSLIQPVRQIAIDDTWSALRFRPM